MKCDKCKNKPWKECCDNCKVLEYSCYLCENVVKVKDYIEHLGKHYNDKNLYLTFCMCGVNKHISYYRFRNARSVDCVFIFIDTDIAILEINSRSMFISIILIYLSCSFLLMD